MLTYLVCKTVLIFFHRFQRIRNCSKVQAKQVITQPANRRRISGRRFSPSGGRRKNRMLLQARTGVKQQKTNLLTAFCDTCEPYSIADVLNSETFRLQDLFPLYQSLTFSQSRDKQETRSGSRRNVWPGRDMIYHVIPDVA